MTVVSIALSDIAYQADKLYSYSVPERLEETISLGFRVLVPFGRGNKLCQGIVMRLERNSEAEDLKAIDQLLDSLPVLTEEQLELAAFMKERLFCTYSDAVRLMLPAGYHNVIRCTYSLKKLPLSPGKLQQAILDYLEDKKNVPEEELEDRLGPDVPRELNRLTAAGILSRSVHFQKKVQDAFLRVVSLADSDAAASYLEGKGAEKEKHVRVLKALMEQEEMTVKELCYAAGCTESVLKTLQKKGLLRIEARQYRRNPYRAKLQYDSAPVVLNEAQQEIYEQLLAEMDAGKPSAALLHGVTGSGKTLIYLKLVEHALKTGRTAMVLVPEIALTAQLTDRFFAYFKERVAVLHSGLSQGERLDQWKRIRDGEATVVLGTRSAVFAPLSGMGILIIDEEHEHTYKSDSAPRYHARDIARLRCVKQRCLLLLGSATPSIESYTMAQTGKYHFYQLKERYNGKTLPNVIVADMRQEALNGNSSIFSRVLVSQLEQTVARGEQAVLFLNKRGYNTFVSCRDCGYVVSCPHCSVSMTYHAVNHMLVCHYCGEMQELPKVCPSCGSVHIRQFGAGTQKVEQDLKELPGNIRVLRMDTDTVNEKLGHEGMIAAFRAHQYDVLLGTQMVAKGLDISNVTLVGVIAADAALFADNFRANERTFAILTQVVGRAGRAGKDGAAVIQTNCPESKVIQMAKAQDYESFYEYEMDYRRALAYPPFSDLYQFQFSGELEAEVRRAATDFHTRLIEMLPKYRGLKYRVYTPTPAAVYRISNKYRYRLLCKCRDDRNFRKAVSLVLSQFHASPRYKTVVVTVDPNPQSFS